MEVFAEPLAAHRPLVAAASGGRDRAVAAVDIGDATVAEAGQVLDRLGDAPRALAREATETQASVAQRRTRACIGVGSCCLPVLAFEPAHTGAAPDGWSRRAGRSHTPGSGSRSAWAVGSSPSLLDHDPAGGVAPTVGMGVR